MNPLPPGQKESSLFPRFGLPQYANRFPTELDQVRMTIGGDIEEFVVADDLALLPRVEQVSDFHCVTTWSKLNLKWSGYSFSDFYNTLILPKVSDEINYVVLKAQDGYKTSLPLEDMMQPTVLLADHLDDEPLTVEHGAPIRLIAPDHYGYKNLKHIKRIGFYTERPQVKQGYLSFMDHPRARVAYEERVSTGPNLIFRYLYRFRIQSTIREFDKAVAAYRATSQTTDTNT